MMLDEMKDCTYDCMYTGTVWLTTKLVLDEYKRTDELMKWWVMIACFSAAWKPRRLVSALKKHLYYSYQLSKFKKKIAEQMFKVTYRSPDVGNKF